MPELALYYTHEKNLLKCELCPRFCRLRPGETGSCQARQNLNNLLLPLTFNKFCSAHLDPIEKKPLYHFFPGKQILSLGSTGCNFHCLHCQNWEISQPAVSGYSSKIDLSPEKIITLCQKNQTDLVAFTYNEPLIQIETLLNTLPRLKAVGIKTILVTNGCINPEPFDKLLDITSSMSIDIKAFTENDYKKLTGIKALELVKRNTHAAYEKGVHVELVTNLVTAINDNLLDLSKLAEWILSLSPYIPWHISTYRPMYKYQNHALIKNSLIKECTEAVKTIGLKYVYSDQQTTTECPFCSAPLIKRYGFSAQVLIQNNCCSSCRKIVPYLHGT